MIEELTIKGYRSLKDVTWRPGKLNVLIGPNAGGKSNLLKALALLRSIPFNRLSEAVVREGGVRAMSWDGRGEVISFRLQGRFGFDSSIDMNGVPLEFRETLAYEIAFRPIEFLNVLKTETEWLVRYADHDMAAGETVYDRNIELSKSVPSPSEAARLLSGSGDRSGPLLGLHREIYPSELYLSSAMSHWALHHNLAVDINSEIRKAPVTQQATRVSDDGQNLVAVLHTLYTSNETFRNDIDDGMRAAFGQEYREISVAPAAAEQRVQLRLRWKSLSHSQAATDLSDGTLRFLLLLAILANPTPPPLIAIDEPETGLHPRMLAIVADFARQAAMRSQVVFSTHSSQLLDAFTDDPPVTTVVRAEAGATTLRNVDGDELRVWLKEFSLGALYRSRELESLE